MRKLWQKQVTSENLTQEEIPVLIRKYNLADGHVHRKWDSGLDDIIDNLGDIFKEVSREQLPYLENEFLERFYGLTKQEFNPERTEYFFCTSASMALEIIANHLRKNKKNLSLIEPCFDNLADIFRRHGVALESLPDEVIVKGNLEDYLENNHSLAVCIVSPNNPTGTTLKKEDLETLIKSCKERNKLLIIDSSFRVYNPSYFWDQYGRLNDSDVNYIVIEDTGKTWPTHELKLSVLAVSKSLFRDIYDIYSDMILHISPFTIKLLTKYLENSHRQNLCDVRDAIQKNRETLYKTIDGTILTPTEQPFMSISWLRINDDRNATDIQKYLDTNGVSILPGTYFYWSDKQKGESFIRISLARDPKSFSEAAKQLGDFIRKYQNGSR